MFSEKACEGELCFTQILTIPSSLSVGQINYYSFPESLLEKHQHTPEFRRDTHKLCCHTAECLQDNRHNVTMKKCSKISILPQCTDVLLLL